LKKWLKIEIEDTGIGIKTQDLNKLFKYFSMLKDDHKINTKGTGLGLNITKRIVESMGGQIAVESKVNKGTKFNMRVIIQIKN
jgi:signal transduction histidine kinase